MATYIFFFPLVYILYIFFSEHASFSKKKKKLLDIVIGDAMLVVVVVGGGAWGETLGCVAVEKDQLPRCSSSFRGPHPTAQLHARTSRAHQGPASSPCRVWHFPTVKPASEGPAPTLPVYVLPAVRVRVRRAPSLLSVGVAWSFQVQIIIM